MIKVMVVDDEPDLREMIDLMMQKEGFETEMAEDGPDFLEKIDVFQPDIVTLDVMMPGFREWIENKRRQEFFDGLGKIIVGGLAIVGGIAIISGIIGALADASKK